MRSKVCACVGMCLLCLVFPWTWSGASAGGGARQSRSSSGRFTRGASKYETLVPRKVDARGTFQSFEVPHFYDLEEMRTRRAAYSRGPPSPPHVRYELALGGHARVVELWPNHALLSPALVTERRRRDLWHGAELHGARRQQCHYVGRVAGALRSHAALSACLDGLAGYVHTGDGERFFVEPEAESRPDAAGRHVHVAFREGTATLSRRRRGRRAETCGVSDDWQTAWQERFQWELETNGDFSEAFVNPKIVIPTVYFLEILVVVDKKFMDSHQNHDTENYILTLMNMVSGYFHDSSVGRTLEIVVVRIIYLDKEEEELDLTISPNAETTLASFKAWAHRINPSDTVHPNHHDIAILITRRNICSENGTICSLLGLAPIAAVCRPEHSATIVKDSGLATGMTITHEIGHLLGCAHDVGDKEGGCMAEASDGSPYVMSVSFSPSTSVWSNCSRRFLGALLDGGLADCLADEPVGHVYRGPDMPPGALYDADYQCRDIMGSEEVCPWKKDELCRELWCKTSGKTCATPGKPAADGSRCGEGHWCLGGECVPVGSRPAAVDGNWGGWGAWSECSRTCGGGVEMASRRCDNPAPENKGRYCEGECRRYRMCNVQPCDLQQPTFREVQCSDHDKHPFGGKLYKWKPYEHAKQSECELFCYNDVPFYASLAPLVKDGTPCRKGSRDICVSGQCVTVGCDWVLGSQSVEDMCGECDGNGSHCKLSSFLYNITKGDQYVEIGKVPKNSYNVQIEEKQSSINTLAVSDKQGEMFFLNGNYSEYPDGEYTFGQNVTGVYSHLEPEREYLRIKGPTSEDLQIYIVFYGHPNHGVSVSYYKRTNVDNKSFDWEFLEWRPCSVHCGGGSQVSQASCVEKKAGKVSESFCNATLKPQPQKRACNFHKCPVRWHTGSWSHCSGCVDYPGEQYRRVQCKRENPIADGEPILAEQSECSGERPDDARVCKSEQPCETTVHITPCFHHAETFKELSKPTAFPVRK